MFANQQPMAMPGASVNPSAEISKIESDHIFAIPSLDELQTLLAVQKGMVINFWNPSCGPCITFKPTYESIANKYSSDLVRFYSINTQAAQEISLNYGVSATPTFLLIVDGEVQNTLQGANKENLVSAIETLKASLGDTVVSNIREEKPSPPTSKKQHDQPTFEELS